MTNICCNEFWKFTNFNNSLPSSYNHLSTLYLLNLTDSLQGFANVLFVLTNSTPHLVHSLFNLTIPTLYLRF